MSAGLNQILIPHPFQLSHHGAAVHGKVVGQRAVGKGQRESTGMILLRQKAEVAQQLFPDRTLAEDFQTFAEMHGFLGDHLQRVADKLTVKGTGLWTALDQMAVINELDPAAKRADYLDRRGIFRDKGQSLAENIPRSQLLQNCLPAVQMGPQQLNSTLQNNTDGFAAGAIGADQFSVFILLFHRVKADHHFFIILPADSLEQASHFTHM